MRRALSALLVFVAIEAAAPALVTAQQQGSVTWSSYDVDLNVHSDGSVQVTETQQIRFQGTYQQGFRLIPTDRVSDISQMSVGEVANGQTILYRSSPVQATNAFRTSSTDQGLRIEWWFQPTTDAARTFVLQYTIRGAIRIYDAGDQLQWKAIYADRPGSVAASSVIVHLPADVAPADLKTSFSLYTADQESRPGALPSAGAGQQTDPRTVQFMLGALPAGTGAEVRTQFPHGLVAATPPAWQADADRADWVQQTLAPIGNFLALLLALAIVAGGGALVFVTWYARGRDPAPGTVPARLDRPPSDLPAPLAGTLVDGRADVQDAVATLVDLAQRGVLSLREEDTSRLVGSRHDMRVTWNPAAPDPSRLRRYERQLLAAMFGFDAQPGAEVLLSEARLGLAAAIPVLRVSLHEAMAGEGLFVRNPETVRGWYRRLGWALVAVGVVLAIAGATTLGWAIGLVWLPGVALALLGVTLLVVARAMPRRTPFGALEAARWRAFRAHLAHPDLPGTAIKPDDLPYAVAFGIDRSFLQRLDSVGQPPPSWYSGWDMPGGVVVLPGGFSTGGGYRRHGGGTWLGSGDSPGQSGDGRGPGGPQSWSDGLADLLNGASDALSSGGGSGGWSGGGFGGGGGGGGGSGGFS